MKDQRKISLENQSNVSDFNFQTDNNDLQKIIDASPTCITIIEKATHKILYANKAAINYFLTPDYLGKPCYVSILGKKRPCARCVLDTNRNPNEEFSFRVPSLNKNFTSTATEIKWNGIDSYLLYLTDNSTEYLKREEVETIVGNIASGFMCIAFYNDGKIVLEYLSDGMFKMLNCDRKFIFDLFANDKCRGIHPDDFPSYAVKLEKLRRCNGKTITSYRVKNGNNTFTWVDVSIVSKLGDGVARLYYNYIDVNDRMCSQQEMFLQKQTLETAIQHSRLMYFEYDFLNRTCSALNSNFNFCSERKTSLKNFLSYLIKQNRIHQDSAMIFEEKFEKLSHGSPYEEFDAIVCSSTTKKWIWMKFRCTVLFDARNNPIKIICTAENIEEQKHFEEKFFTIMEQHGLISWSYNINLHQIVVYTLNKNGSSYSTRYIDNVPESMIENRSVHPDDAEIFRETIKKIERGDESVGCDIRLFEQKHKSYRWIRLRYTAVKSIDGVSISAIGSHMDINEEVERNLRHQNSLRLQKANLPENLIISAYSNLTSNSIVELNDMTDYKIVQKQNTKSINELLNYLKNCVVDETDREIFGNKFNTRNLIETFNDGQNIITVQTIMQLDKDIPKMYVKLKIYIDVNVPTQEIMAFITATNVSRRVLKDKIVDKTILENFEYVLAYDITLDKIVSITAEKETPFDWLLNKKTSDYSHYIESKYFDSSDTKKLLDLYKVGNITKLLDANKSIKFNYPIKNSDGDEKIKSIRIFYIDKAMSLLGISIADITELELESERQKQTLSDALQIANKANHAKTDFLSSMSHDIRTPMNAIVGMTDMALSELDDKKRVEDCLATIKASSAQLLSLINDILEMSRIEAGKLVIDNFVFSNSEEFYKVIKRTAPIAKSRGINFEYSINVEHDTNIGDALKIHRVVDNLLGNALKFTPAGGTVSFTFNELPSDKPHLSICQLVIKDTGIGIKKECLDTIFEPFYMAGRRNSSQEGSGLGLAIVKNIVDFIGGNVKVSSAVGKGTTFIVTLPLRLVDDSDAPEKEPIEVDISLLNGKKALVAEDHPINQQVIKYILEKAGITVTIAENGKIALDLFKNSSPQDYNLILMDVQMPEMNGYESTMAIRAQKLPNAKTIPIIAMTANAFTEDVQHCIDAGMNRHLAKPVEPATLYKTILEVLNLL